MENSGNTGSLYGKVAIVTGSARGIGYATAKKLAVLGAAVVVADRKQESCDAVAQQLADEGHQALGMVCEVTREDHRQQLVKGVVARFGKIDILVNNAGVGGEETPILNVTEEDWDRTFDVDLKAVYFLTQAVANQMKQQNCEPGTTPYRIINLASAAGIKAPKYASVYGTAKAGVIHSTKIMANEWARYGISVNAVAPGYVYTDMTKDVIADQKNASAVKKMIALRRFAMPEEIANVVGFLASPAASYITGVTIPVDGGMSIS